MTLLIKLENDKPVGYPILEENFKTVFPSYKYPDILTPENLKPLGYGLYDFSPIPSEQKYKKPVEIDPVQNEFGVWIQQWTLVDMNEEEKKEQEENAIQSVKFDRMLKLRSTDWIFLPDVPKKSNIDEWLDYRQKLRDITKQEGFPWEVEWPEEPK